MRIMDRFPKSKNERVCFWEILFPVEDDNIKITIFDKKENK